MSQQTQERPPLNGVDTPSLFATINAVKENRELAKFKWRASNKWIKGTKSRGTVEKAARAVVRGSDEVLANYQTERDELSLPLFRITDEIAAYQWDLDTVKKLHVEMSTEMNREG